MKRRHRRLAAILLALGLIVGPGMPAAAAPGPAVKILIIGDSVTQGSAGDWTWRYRLWESLEGDAVNVDLVGPRNDLFDNVADWLCTPEQASPADPDPTGHAPCSTAYADPDFDTDHAARWGMSFAIPDTPIDVLMQHYQPDVVIEARGINDLAWFHRPPDDVLGDLENEIVAARAINPDVHFVVAQLPQTWRENVDTYNETLTALASSWSNDDSQIAVAATGSGFEEDVDTWDPAHLAATGEVKFAAAVADALAGIGIGEAYDGVTPDEVSNGHWGGAELTATVGDREAELAWIPPPGGRQQWIWLRDVTIGQPWTKLPFAVEGTSWTAGGLVNGHTFEYRLQAAKGTAVADEFSNVVSVVPGVPSGTAGPTPTPTPTRTPTPTDVPTAAPLPARPAGVTLARGPHRLVVAWGPVLGATSYRVTWSAANGTNGQVDAITAPVRLRGLVAGERYDVTVAAVNADGAGPPARAHARPDGPRVPGPQKLAGKATGAHRVELTWRRSRRATAYAIWQRNATGWELVDTVTGTSATVRRVADWPTRFKVRAWHQLKAGGWSPRVRVSGPGR